MNPILELKGGMRPVKNEGGGGGVSFPKDFHFHVSAVDRLIERLTEVHQYWSSADRGISKALVNVHYKRVVPKTGRISVLLAEKVCSQAETIRGAKFETLYDDGKAYHRHVFTHYVEVETIARTLKQLQEFKSVLDTCFKGNVEYKDTEDVKAGVRDAGRFSKTMFSRLLKDVDSVADFSIPKDTTVFVGVQQDDASSDT